MSEESRDPWVIKEMPPDVLVAEYKAFVGSIVTRLSRTLHIRVALDDLEAYAYEGLLEAHSRYDPEAGVLFSSFAYYRIRGAVMDGCRKEGWLTRERSRDADLAGAVDEYMETSGASESASPRPNNFAEAVDRVTNMVDDVTTIFLLHEHDASILDEVEQATQYKRLERRTNLLLLRAALAVLTDEEREIITRHHLERERMDSIAEEFGHSRSWVSRVNTRALEKMRNYFRENE